MLFPPPVSASQIQGDIPSRANMLDFEKGDKAAATGGVAVTL
jgi:hypothetical protein